MIQRALVTGHKGFVGAAVHTALKQGKWGEYRVDGIDIKDGSWADCRAAFADNEKTPYHLVVHCAAVVGGRLTISEDPLAVAVDLALDSDLFRWAVRGNAKRIVYFSSSAAYPTGLQTPGRTLKEDDIAPLTAGNYVGVPDLTYGWAKLSGEMLAQYARDAGVDVHILRPFSGYGPDQEASYPFPAFIQRAARRADPFDIWGDGEQTRDFVHISDIIGAVHAVIEEDVQTPVNIGSGRPTSFNELARMVTSAAGYSPEFHHRLDRPVGPEWRVSDTSRLHRVYRPKFKLEDGIRQALS